MGWGTHVSRIQLAILMMKMMPGTAAVADAGAPDVGGATSASAAAAASAAAVVAAASDHSCSSQRPEVALSMQVLQLSVISEHILLISEHILPEEANGEEVHFPIVILVYINDN